MFWYTGRLWSKWNGETLTESADFFFQYTPPNCNSVLTQLTLVSSIFVGNGLVSYIAGKSHFYDQWRGLKKGMFTAEWALFSGKPCWRKNLGRVESCKSRHFKFSYFNHHPLLCQFGKMQEFAVTHIHTGTTLMESPLYSLTYRYNRYSGNERLKCLGRKIDSWMIIIYILL